MSSVFTAIRGWTFELRSLSQLTGRLRLRNFHWSPSLTAATTTEKEEAVSLEAEDFFESDKPKPLTEEEILAKRNKSRLAPWHFKKIHGEDPFLETPYLWYHATVKYKRRMYAKHGEKSGINPGIQWPTHEELNKRLEYESIAFPFTFQELVANNSEKKRLEQEYYDNRTKELDEKVALIDKQIKEVLNKRAAKEKELQKAQQRKEKMMEEVRRHFGYTVDPRDERFQEMLAQKEKEEKKKLKAARKEEKQAKLLERLQQSSKTKNPKGEADSSSVSEADKV